MVLLVIMVVLSFIIGLVGMIATSQATMGVGIVGFGCLLAIMTRIIQAGQHQKAMMNQLRDMNQRIYQIEKKYLQ